jgi:ribosomal protein L13
LNRNQLSRIQENPFEQPPISVEEKEEKEVNTTDDIYTQPIGLDVGTSRIVVARAAGKKYAFDVQLNAFFTLPYSRLAESLLQRQSVLYQVNREEIVVSGNDAEKLAEVFHAETRRPMKEGILNPQEPHALDVVRSIVGKMLGKSGVPGQKVYFSIPAPTGGNEGGIRHHQESVRQVLSELGYAPTPVEEGLAVVFGELSGSNFSGIGISCGSGLCNVCLAVLSVPVISFSVPRAGDFIDAQAALVTGDVATRMRVQKEQSFRLNGMNGSRVNNALTVYYDQVIENLVKTLKESISSARKLPKMTQAIPLVLAGGTVLPDGFFERFREALQTNELPVKLSEVRVSSEPLNSTARGLLMAALC